MWVCVHLCACVRVRKCAWWGSVRECSCSREQGPPRVAQRWAWLVWCQRGALRATFGVP